MICSYPYSSQTYAPCYNVNVIDSRCNDEALASDWCYNPTTDVCLICSLHIVLKPPARWGGVSAWVWVGEHKAWFHNEVCANNKGGSRDGMIAVARYDMLLPVSRSIVCAVVT